jgi:hypothetical protein
MKLTQTRIDNLKCPAGKRDMLVFDEEPRGLGVRVTANGGKTYLAQYNFHGQKRRIPLGSTSGVSLAKVRGAVRSWATWPTAPTQRRSAREPQPRPA